MTNVVRINRRAVGGAAGGPSVGVMIASTLSFNEQTQTLYYGLGADASTPPLATSVIAIGGTGAFASLTANNTFSGSNTFSSPIISTVATGTAPFTISSTTVVTNLNADLLDGQHGSFYQNASNLNSGTISAALLPAFSGDISTPAGSTITTLATVLTSTPGSYGSTNTTPVITVNGKGLITAASSATITPPSIGAVALTGSNLTGPVNANKASTLTAAATVSIGSATGEYIHITGSTTITAFDTIQAGTERTVVFDGALTLTNNANIILPGAANITTAAGDSSMFRSEGAGVWRCVNYTPASGKDLEDSLLVHLAGTETITGSKTFSSPIISTVATGTAPFTISSTTLVTNLNADLLDGQHGSFYQNATNINAGLLATTYGGTGLSSIGTANQILGVNAGATGLEYKTLSAGTGISLTNATGSLTIANTGVTSCALSLPSIFTVTGSPVTTTGVLTATLASQSANTFFAAPNGSSGTPTFRAMLAADVPKTLDHTWITDFDTQVRTSRLDQMAAPTASVSMNSQKIINLLDPTNPQDAATKNYVDSVATGLTTKAAVLVATTGALPTNTFSSNVLTASANGVFPTIDGVTVSVGARILVKNEVNAVNNGIYTVTSMGSASTPWTLTRASDSNTTASVQPGDFVFVEEGTLLQTTGWVISTFPPLVLNTTSITWTQFSSAGIVLAGSGLTKSGNTISAVVDSTSVAVNGSNQLSIATTWSGQTAITTLGTITTGTWNATLIAGQFGGTGRNISGDASGTFYKNNGSGTMIPAVLHTDYLSNISVIDCGTF